jgi:hypothetical protein
LSGLYYNHQYVPLIPLALAVLVAWLTSDASSSGDAVAFASAAAALGLVAATVSHEAPNLAEQLAKQKARVASAKAAAAQIDRALECTGETRYAYIGTNGIEPFGWTKHSPLGPFFFQYNPWFAESEPQHRQELLAELKQARLLVFRQLATGDFNDQVSKAIDARFHPGLPPKCASIALRGDWSFRWADD